MKIDASKIALVSALVFFVVVICGLSLNADNIVFGNSGSELSRLQASVKASAHDARKLLDHDDAGIIALTDAARHRLEQIEARAK
jgi:hypothetical protein